MNIFLCEYPYCPSAAHQLRRDIKHQNSVCILYSVIAIDSKNKKTRAFVVLWEKLLNFVPNKKSIDNG